MEALGTGWPALRLRAWLVALRPRTLLLGLAPLAPAWAAVRAAGGELSFGTAVLTLAAVVAIQAGTNLVNDAGDWRRGADGPARRGPPRAAASGWLSASALDRAAALCFAVALVAGAALARIGGWPVVVIGAAAVACGIAYTAGPRPIAYGGGGEWLVLAFFGPVAAGGAAYLHDGALHGAALAAGVMLGCLAAAVLAINNARDAPTDRAAGRRTLAVRRGPAFARAQIRALLALPFGIALAWAALTAAAAPLPALAAAPYAGVLAARAADARDGAAFNALLRSTIGLNAAVAALLAAGIGWLG
ncbi:MAG: 1,4-dihydroxy-2-naphthoate octaprenyltransferase [Burkholderiales bacterium]|nr:1,4-dihydroxy-2-naphthoate octaprenyltransferase [Burkholderiales bacterium]